MGWTLRTVAVNARADGFALMTSVIDGRAERRALDPPHEPWWH